MGIVVLQKIINYQKKSKMKNSLLKFVFLFIATSCMCGICSKDDAGKDDNSGPAIVEPALKPDSTWAYLNDAPSLVYFYTGNTRAQSQKWLATKIQPAFSAISISTNKRYLVWHIENSGDTRFLSNKLNPGGKESVSVSIREIASTPGTGSYTLDIDYNSGYCWYEVYTSSGALHDSTRVQGPQTSTFNIAKMEFFQSIGSTIDRYKMSGNATFNIMYWQNGTGSTTDIHTLQCTFNNVFIDFVK